MKSTKLCNIIFPLWFVLFFPPVIIFTFLGNYLFDSLVVLLCYHAFRLSNIQDSFKTFYKKSILKVWLLGFAADITGVLILFITGILGDFLNIPHKIISAINYDPYRHPVALLITILAVFTAAFFIFLFSYQITFKKLIVEKALRIKVALTIAVITAPWTFLLPTKLFIN